MVSAQSAIEREAIGSKPSTQVFRMPQMDVKEPDAQWMDIIRHFHLSGEKAQSEVQLDAETDLRPAAITPLLTKERMWRDHPLLIVEEAEESVGIPVRLSAVFSKVLEEMNLAGEPSAVLQEHIPRLSGVASRVLQGHNDVVPLHAVLEQICTEFVKEFELSEAAQKDLEEQIDHLKARLSLLPASSVLLDLGEHTLTVLFTSLLSSQRRKIEKAFIDQVKKLVMHLSQLLLIDKNSSPEGYTSEAFSASMGEAAASKIDFNALSQLISVPKGSKRLENDRRQRVENALSTLTKYLEQPSAAGITLVHPGLIPHGINLGSIKTIESQECLQEASDLFDRQADQMVEVFRSIRVAKLEIARAYQPKVHDSLLARMDKRSLTAEEIRVLAPVVVLDTAKNFQKKYLGVLTEVLCDEQPIKILVIDSQLGMGSRGGQRNLPRYIPRPAQIAVAHREAMVIQSSLAQPDHLVEGFKGMSESLRPSVAVVTIPTWDSSVSPGLRLAVAFESRATPCFSYDPDAGRNLAEQFDISTNPQPERTWTVQQLAYLNGSGTEEMQSTDLTVADLVALDSEYRSHFLVIPRHAWSDDQLELSEYLAEIDNQKSQSSIPFIWLVDPAGNLVRAVVSREMAYSCSDVMRSWRVLQELGGTDSAYAKRAADLAQREAEAKVEETRQELEAAHAQELESVRSEAASEAMERLANVLLNLDAVPMAQSAPLKLPVAEKTVPEPSAKEAAPTAAPEVVEEEEDAGGFNEPFIDSELCTSCNECTNLNSALFKYNGDKQAYIAEPQAGTFAQLVQAAEKCPARCIHPGAPRSGDNTATDELIAKASAFN